MTELGSIYGTTNVDGSNTLVIDFSNVQINGTLNLPNSSNNGYGNTDDILISRGANNAPLWSSNYAKTDTTYTAGNNMVLNGTAFSVATSPTFATVIGEGFFGVRGNSGYIDYNPNHGCNFVVHDNNGNTGNLRFYANLTYHSDDRIKHNEIDVSNGLTVIRQLKPQRYIKTPKITTDKTEISNTGTIEVGFIAQEVKQINDLSFAVDGGNGTTLDPYGNETEDLYALNYNAVFTYNIAATKELDNIVTSQKEEITVLKNALNILLSEAGKPTI